MNNKLTLSELAQLLSSKAGVNRRQAEDFIKEFFASISSALEAGDSVRLNGLGTFKLTGIDARKSVDVNTGETIEIPGHNRISFLPDKETAKRINAPFEMFEAVELGDNVTEADLEIDATPAETAEETMEEPEEQLQEKQEEQPAPTAPAAHFPEVEWVEESPESPATEPEIQEASVVEETPIVKAETPEVAETSEIPEAEVSPRRKKFHIGSFIWGLLAGGVIASGIFIWCTMVPEVKIEKDLKSVASTVKEEPNLYSEETESEEIVKEEEAPLATEEEAMPATIPSDTPKVVYDTITKTRYLTTMAKDHYGNYHLWPYIYMENASRLGHPDRIKPGTRVVVPDLKKYGVNPASKTDIDAAKRKGAEIYSRYK